MNPDFLDFLKALIAQDARFIVVGAHASPHTERLAPTSIRPAF